LTLESIDNVHGSDGLPLGMFGVGDGVADDILKEDLENTSSLFIDEARDTFDTTSASQTANSGFGNTLDVITQNFAMALGASLSKSFASFATSGHFVLFALKILERILSESECTTFLYEVRNRFS
jgi:hypothetical protein